MTRQLLKAQVPEGRVVIKPNIVRPAPPPVTTDVRVVEGVLRAFREAGVADLCVAEGSGTGNTLTNLRGLGYDMLGIPLVDLDKEKAVTLKVPDARVWKEIRVPEMLVGAFIISVPVLKQHTMCGVTLSLKNMVGILPSRYYAGYWSYKKSEIHRDDTDGCIADIISVIQPAWAVVDATIGMRGSHLAGTPFKPPVNLVFASPDPLEADRFGCSLLGNDWQKIGHLGLIGSTRSAVTSDNS